ncbi:MAG: chemotaxis protein CheW [Betaproteobacteria bacterium]|jgi:twitching motility protein PilI|nr:chemotaxis protein CheW [Betaproteobacteria bacterium]
MSRPARIDLRLFQQELATRLASKTTAQVESSRLGLSCAGERWLIRLADAAEVVAVPPLTAVPLTRPWFLGLANIRGNLYSVVDLARFLGREAVVPHGGGGKSRLILFGSRAGDMNVGVVVQSVLGLRNIAELSPAPSATDAPAWYGQRWNDADGGTWQEFDLAQLAADPVFLRIGL